MGSWVGPWVRFDKMTRRQAIETCDILIEQRDKQIRRAEAAEAKLEAVVLGACRDLTAAEAERDALRYVDKAHTIVMRRCDEAEARLAVTQTKVANTIGSFCECHSEHRPCMFCEVRAVLAAVDGPAEGYYSARGPVARGAAQAVHARNQRAAVDPPADHIAIFDGPPLRSAGSGAGSTQDGDDDAR